MTLQREVAQLQPPRSLTLCSFPDCGSPEMDLEQLRDLNQDLLRRLKANQEEFRKCLPFKDAGHVTFVSDTEEHLILGDGLSAQPFLGYDWIAGLLETDTSLSEKPEEYFAELQNFRQVNKEACIRDHGFELEDVNSSAVDQEMETDTASHQCVFCYRLNKRLFTVPTDPESACPVCKTTRAEKPPETLVEPAFVRVSFPRDTFLPTYKHKIHRRKSYEMEDNLALPSEGRGRTNCLTALGRWSSNSAAPLGSRLTESRHATKLFSIKTPSSLYSRCPPLFAGNGRGGTGQQSHRTFCVNRSL
ncbi:hypothetical protein E2320_006147, partial [Naja naja]